MKKLLIPLFAVAFGMTSVINASIAPADEYTNIYIKNNPALILGYDKSMGEKTIKAAVIDSYFRNICKKGKIIRWNKASMPLNVYIQDTKDIPEYYRDVVIEAYQTWQRVSEGLVRFNFVEDPAQADMKCYFKSGNQSDSIGAHAFSVKGDILTGSTIVFNKSDLKGHSHDSKQLFSSALQEIGHSLGLSANSSSIYDVMYPIGTKFNTEITTRDLKTLALLYSVVPDITNKPLSNEEKAVLMTSSEVLATLNLPFDEDNSETITSNDIAVHLALAEQYRKRAEYGKAAQEYQIVAQSKVNKVDKADVYYEIAVMFLDAEMFDDAKSCAQIAWQIDQNDRTIILPPLINYYMKRSNTAVKQLEELLKENPYNKYAYKLLCQIYREKHHENLLNSTIKRYGKTAGVIE